MPTTKEQRIEKEETMTTRALDQTKENITRTTTTHEERKDTLAIRKWLMNIKIKLF